MHNSALLQIKETFACTSSNGAFQPQAAHSFNLKRCNQRFSGQILNPVTNRMESLTKATKATTLSKLLLNLCPLTQHPLCVAALSWQIVSDDKIQIRILMLRRGALSTFAGLYHPDWPHTNSNPQNLNQRCPLQISSQALFLEGPQLHLAAAVKSDSQDKERKSSKSGLDFSQRPGAHHEQIHNQDHLDTISPNSQFSKKFSIFLQQLSQLQKKV